ncbi:MAG: HAD family hydrolase [Mycoplasmataceae bacterium]|jgi:Cof subfamily protein (haloacid dehalogenase superfamily)|nr:HAD family hydrolase [Mycoplasmataceae bacterium]
MKKIIFCDIDGTLIKGLSKISYHNLLAFKKFMDAGGKVVLSTGRSSSSIRGVIAQIEKFTKHKLEYVICSTGGYIYDFLGATTITHPISNFNSRKIYEYCRKKRIWFWGYNEEANRRFAVFASNIWFGSITRMFKNIRTLMVKKTTDLTCFKIITLSLSKKKINILSSWIKQEFNSQINVTHQNPMMLELNAVGVSKGKAIKYILNQLNIEPGDAVAIGNGVNDIEAFNAVGLSFAVNTRNKTVFSQANHHYSYYRDAVYDAINEHILDLETKNH